MITAEDIEAFSGEKEPAFADEPMNTDAMRAVARCDPPSTASREYMERAADEIDRLRKALSPFVHAYAQTCEAFGVDVSGIYKTANCVSNPYIEMTDYVQAYQAYFGKAWEKMASPLDDMTFVESDQDTYRA